MATNKRRSPLGFRCSQIEAAKLAEAAKATGQSRSLLIRKAALAAAEQALACSSRP